jgi:hypothetical protein
MLEEIDKITEFNDIHEFMQDTDLDETLDIIIKLMAKPDVPIASATILITKLQAMSAKFAVLATWYTTVAKGPSGSINHTKKNVYYTLADQCDKLAGALKYVARGM